MDYAWCDNCKTIQPVTIEAMETINTTGHFRGGDITCQKCAWIVATVYTPLIDTSEEGQAIMTTDLNAEGSQL